MIDNYDDRNREQTLEAVANFDGEQLQEFLEFERAHKDRKTVIEPLERELVTVTPTSRPYVAGLWFGSLSKTKVARRTTRIEQAIDSGDLEVVG